MSDKKEIFQATKATDKRHFRKPAKVRFETGKGSTTTGGKPAVTHGKRTLSDHFRSGHGK